MNNKAVLEYVHSFFEKFKPLFYGIFLLVMTSSMLTANYKINNIHLFLRLRVPTLQNAQNDAYSQVAMVTVLLPDLFKK